MDVLALTVIFKLLSQNTLHSSFWIFLIFCSCSLKAARLSFHYRLMFFEFAIFLGEDGQ